MNVQGLGGSGYAPEARIKLGLARGVYSGCCGNGLQSNIGQV